MKKTIVFVTLAAMLALALLLNSPAEQRAQAPASEPGESCNRPISDMPPGQDGCHYFVPIERPAAPIAPPCISNWRVEEEVGGDQVKGVLITVAHPELQSYAPAGWVHLVRNDEGEWTATVDATVSCGKDEAPLAWALLEILNGGETDQALHIYHSPLRADLLAEVLRLAGWQGVFVPNVVKVSS